MEKFPPEESNEPLAELAHEKKDVNLGKRDTLRKLVGLGLMATPFVQPMKEVVEETVLLGKTERELDLLLERLRNEYGVEIDFSADSGGLGEIPRHELSFAERRDLTENAYSALRLYPREYIEHVGLKVIHGMKWIRPPQLEWYKQLFLKGFVDAQNKKVLYLNKESLFSNFAELYGWTNGDTMQYTTYHELYHIADTHLADVGFNTEWRRTGNEGDKVAPDKASFFRPRTRGHASGYGTASPDEDRAEIAAMLFTKYGKLLEFSGKEEELARKINMIKEEFKERSGGLIDESYWDLLRGADREQIQKYFEDKRALN